MSLRTKTYTIPRMIPVLLVALLLLAAMPVMAADQAMPETQGRIDRIDYNNEVVINDSLFRLTPETRYYSALGADAAPAGFVEGTTVAYSLAPGSRIVLDMWKTE